MESQELQTVMWSSGKLLMNSIVICTRCWNDEWKPILSWIQTIVLQHKIRFYGVVCGQDGLLLDPWEVSCLKQMSPSAPSATLNISRSGKLHETFMSNANTLTAPLNELLKEENRLSWYPAQQKVLNDVSSTVTLAYFHTMGETTLQVDASMRGLGAALRQDANQSLSQANPFAEVDKTYVNIERERNFALTYTAAASLSIPITNLYRASTWSNLQLLPHVFNGCC